jgi:hypothetical protein
LLCDFQFLKTFENFEIVGRTLQYEQIAGLHLFIGEGMPSSLIPA